MAMGGIVFLAFVILFALFVFGAFSNREPREVPSGDRRGALRDARAARRDGSSSVAQKAMSRAGYQGGDAYARVMDLGMLAYRQSDEPRIVRSGAVWTDTEYIRPFVDLWLPHRARGKVRFELVDGAQRLRYADEARYDLDRGKNTLLPQTWLPMKGRAEDGDRWNLRVMAGETLLAVHDFGWQAPGGEIKQYMVSDGEISPELLHVLTDERGKKMSLSDLLSDQDNR